MLASKLNLKIRGAVVGSTAEIIPEEPDAGNAAVGSILSSCRFFGRVVWRLPFYAFFGFFAVGSGKELRKNMKNSKTANLYALCESAMLVALATVIGLLKFPPFTFDLWANGGSIDFVMVPLIIIGWRRGIKWSVPACLAYGFIKCTIGGGLGWGILSILFDYVLAYGMVGLAGLFKGKKLSGLVLGTVVATLGRFFFHFLSGITIWKLAEPETLFGINFEPSTMATVYSLVYNGSFMLGEFVYCLAILLVLYNPLKKAFKM